MPDVRAIDDYFEDLGMLWDECALPNVRALATARFITALPDDLRGRRYYLQESASRLLPALERMTDRFRDPKHQAWVRDALERLVRDGLLETSVARALLAASAAEGSGRTQGTDVPAAMASAPPGQQILLRVPLLHPIPAPSWDAEAPGQVGLITELTLVPRRRVPGAPLVSWNNAHTGESLSGMRALNDVAADAFMAACEAVPDAPQACEEGLGFEISISEKEAPIVGDSIGLGLCVAFTAALKACAGRGWDRRPRGDLAWTGRISPRGEVGRIEALSLAHKIRAARQGGVAGIVIPAGMADATETERSGFQVAELAHVSGFLLSEPTAFEITEPWPGADRARRSIRRRPPWLAGGLIAAAVVAAILIGLALRGGDGDRSSLPGIGAEPAPALADLRVETIHEQRELRVTWPGQTAPLLVPTEGPVRIVMKTDRLAGDERGALRIAYATAQAGGHPGRLVVYDPLAQETVWRYIFTESGLPGDPLRDRPGVSYSTKVGRIADCDGDEDDEIVLAVALNPEADCLLWLFDGLRDPVGVVRHIGYFEQIEVVDLDFDGTPEILAAGHHTPSKGVSLVVLHANQFAPFRSSASMADPSTQGGAARVAGEVHDGLCLTHLVVPLIPEFTAASGITELWWPEGEIFELVGTERKATVPRLAISATHLARRVPDYLIAAGIPCGELRILPTANMEHFVATQGPLVADLCGEAFLDRWRSAIFCGDRIQHRWSEE
ncbi:MAG: hypothetical protein GF330_12700 [Candidatus Eisenbacteria bacterium]|nr:hypothetical protein [Candidatus Eisenbacteria bacterium]